MAFDAFLKLDGIDGESQDAKHKGEIEVLSFSWGITNATTIGSATGGAGAGKASVHDFSIVKMIDATSPLLFEKCCTGEHITGGMFTLVDRQTGLGFYKIRFDEILVSSVQPAANPGSHVPTESLSLNFSQIEISASDSKGGTTNSIICSMDQKLG
ncbi:MAG TPA: type VI secretion system tube protein Hcp [Vicinamibacterales bacterium]|nr:type VI secretion system tube protein Hcp [Vicinamibacterales bacterium]